MPPIPSLPRLQTFFNGLLSRFEAAAAAARDKANAVLPGSGDAAYKAVMDEFANVKAELNVSDIVALALAEASEAFKAGSSPVHHAPTDLAG